MALLRWLWLSKSNTRKIHWLSLSTESTESTVWNCMEIKGTGQSNSEDLWRRLARSSPDPAYAEHYQTDYDQWKNAPTLRTPCAILHFSTCSNGRMSHALMTETEELLWYLQQPYGSGVKTMWMFGITIKNLWGKSKGLSSVEVDDAAPYWTDSWVHFARMVYNSPSKHSKPVASTSKLGKKTWQHLQSFKNKVPWSWFWCAEDWPSPTMHIRIMALTKSRCNSRA